MSWMTPDGWTISVLIVGLPLLLVVQLVVPVGGACGGVVVPGVVAVPVAPGVREQLLDPMPPPLQAVQRQPELGDGVADRVVDGVRLLLGGGQAHQQRAARPGGR